MRRKLRRLRKSDVTKHEIKADIVFFLVPAIISLIAVFIFDIHWSLYPGEVIFSRFIFNSPVPYIAGAFTGGVIGFFIIKLFLLGVHEEEKI